MLAADLIVVFTNQGSLVAPGENIDVAAEIRNIGDAAAAASTGRIVLSPDETIGDDNDIALALLPTDPINPGASGGGGGTIQIPSNLPPGLWFLGALTDVLDEIPEDDEGNNTAISDSTVVRNVPDLAPSLLLPEPSPLPLPGGQIEVTYAIVNNSDFAAGAQTSRVVLSPDGSFGGPNDVILATHDIASIAPNDLVGFVETLTIPADLPLGTWRLGVVADVNDELVELDETNNTEATNFDLVIVVLALPDLTPAIDFQGLGIPANPGEVLTLEFTIGNIASAVAGESTARVVLSLDQILGNSDDIVLGSSEIAQMGTFGSTLVSTAVTIPANLGAGAWFLGILADADGEVLEADETNNSTISPTAAVTVPAIPNIEVLGGSNGTTPILHETKASRSKGTGFGPVQEPGETKSTLFVISNTGNSPLTITSIEPRGQRPQDYTITQFPEQTIAAGGTTAFIVRFDPTAFGTRRANIAIFTNDPDRSRFTMRIAGRGTPDPTLADIAVTGGTITINDGDRKARTAAGQRFGFAALGSPIVKIYTITNTGQGVLTFTSPVIRVGGNNSPDFAIVGVPNAAFLAPGESTTFSIRFQPSAAGLRRAVVEVLSNDPDEGIFDFKVIGTGV